MSLYVNDLKISSIHFTGIFGSGMSALAQFLSWQGIHVSGSDRGYNKFENSDIQNKLIEAKCTLYEQNGSAITATTDAVCISTAIERDNPDLKAADNSSIPVVHRSDVLAALIQKYKTIAVAGTSGKSTVTAMIFEFLTDCGKSPSLISGAPLIKLQRQHYIGNAFYGLSDLLIIEADESDGTLVKYSPYMSVLLNVSKDHKSIEEVVSLFKKFISNSEITIANSDENNFNAIKPDISFSIDSKSSTFHPDKYMLSNTDTTLYYGNDIYTLPMIGKHNCSNCAAAIAVCAYLGCPKDKLINAVNTFEGVNRRFAIKKTGNGVIIIDDFAHNPEKISAAIHAARMLSPTLKIIYQPHGFGPTRFLRNEYISVFSTHLLQNDELYFLPIFYAGGNAVKDISSYDLKNDLSTAPFNVFSPDNRDDVISLLISTVKPDDCILVMGGRDNTLSLFAEQLYTTISTLSLS